jgi:predicted secreted protein
MKWTSILAIYLLFWVMCAFLLLPFGVRTHEEAGVAKTPGQADSAPANFRPGRLALRATVFAAVVTALYVANYVYGWITPDELNVFGEPPRAGE